MLFLVLLGVSTLAAEESSASISAGNQLVAKAAQTINKQPALEAKVRQWATMFGQPVSGAGFYLQLPDSDRVLLRYEFKLQVADQLTSLLQVNDGTTLWLRHDYGDLRSQVYVDVRQLREAKQQLDGGTSNSPGFAPDLALGGLGEILRNLETNFRFEDPQQSELLELPTWEITGSWKPERIARFAPDAAAKSGTAEINTEVFPSHLPDVVKVVLGRDTKFPLFPYRILFGRTKRSDGVASIATNKKTSIEALVTLELYEVQRRPDLKPADFAFQPSDDNVEDRTDEYLRKLGLVKEER
jgi:hypothetical protein